jgi:hypothetical protein
MADQDSRSLLCLLQEASELPDYIQDDAVTKIVAEWRQRSPLVGEVLNGCSTFEDAIRELVEENQRLTFLNRGRACNTPQFAVMAEKTAKRFDGVLPLESCRFSPRAGTAVCDLTDTLNARSWLWADLKEDISTGVVLMLLLWGGFSYFVAYELFAYWPWAIAIGIGVGLVNTAGCWLLGYPRYLDSRRWLAQETLKWAKFLDTKLKPRKA